MKLAEIQHVIEELPSDEQTALASWMLERVFDVDSDIAQTETLLREAEESGEYVELDDAAWTSIERQAFEDIDRRKSASARGLSGK